MLMHYEQYKQVAQRHHARACYARGSFINLGIKCEFARRKKNIETGHK